MARPPESEPGNAVKNASRRRILSRRNFLGLGAAGVVGGGLAWYFTRGNDTSTRTPSSQGGPATGEKPPLPTPDTLPVNPSTLMRVENGQIVRGNRVEGAMAANIYSILNQEGCGSPSPVTSEDQREMLQEVKRDGYNWVRGWCLSNEGSPADLETSLKNLVGHAKDLDMNLILTLSANDSDGCGEGPKDLSWYQNGYKQKGGYLDHIANVERILSSTPGGENVILELANEMGNYLQDHTPVNLTPQIASDFLNTSGKTIKDINPHRLVMTSILSGTPTNPLLESGNFDQLLATKKYWDIVDMHYYAGDPLLPYDPRPNVPTDPVRTAAKYQTPLLVGEVGVNPADLPQYHQLFNQLKTQPNVFGVGEWGKKIVGSDGAVLYETPEKQNWPFTNDSKVEELFADFAPIFSRPVPNRANRLAGISRAN